MTTEREDALSSDGKKPSRQDQAAAWFAAERAGVMLVEQRQEFDAWRADPRNQAALDAMRELWDDLAILKGTPLKESKPAPRPSRVGPPRFAVAAALMLAVVAVAAGAWFMWPNETAIQTIAGEQKTRTLPDGSVIAVNVVSDVAYAITTHSRTVRVQEGEASFNVRPDATRPFVVRTGDFEVRAVGTAFNVRQRDGVIEVAVSEGSVKICRAGDAETILATLGAGEKLEFPAQFSGSAFGQKLLQVPPAQVSEWRMRVVTYEDASVREVIDDFNRYFEQALRVEQPDLLKRRVTVRLQVDDRDQAIATLASLLDVRVRRTAQGDVLGD